MNDKMSRRGTYKNYDPELKRIVMETGNIDLATSWGVPRTTAISWMTKTKKIPLKNDSGEQLLNDEVKSLRRDLEIERAKVQFVSSLGQYLNIIRNGKRKVSRSIKKIFIEIIEEYRMYCSLKDLLSLIKLRESRYFKWRSEVRRCNLTRNYECAVKRPNQLTGDEVILIRMLAKCKRYFHYSMTALWKFALRNGIVVCSRDSWFKYVNKFDLNTERRKGRKDRFKIGVRAKYPNQIWHLDLTVIKLLDGSKVYLQAIIDNYSRYIIHWDLNVSKEAINTRSLIQEAKNRLKEEDKINMYMDQGSENTASIVKTIFIGSKMNQVFAQVDVKYSNSMIEAFFRSLKVNFLYEKIFKNLDGLRRCIKFYIREHNNKIPHSAFKFQTPREIYQGTWTNENDKYIKELKQKALEKRKIQNEKILKCSHCLA